MSVDIHNKNALAYNESISDDLRKIVSPLFDHLGFNHFAYSKFMQGERYMTMSVDASWTAQYFNHDLDKYLLFEKLIIPKHSKRVIIWDLQQDNGLLELLRNHGYCHGISLFYRHDDVMEGWHFATTAQNTQINEMYTNNFDYIERFVLYFQEKAQEIIDSTDKRRLAFYKNSRKLDFSKMMDTISVMIPEHKAFLEAVSSKRYPFLIGDKLIFLSATEFACLKGISEGQTAKLIGINRKISNRTVEVNIQNIKNKFDMSCKTQLVGEFKKSIYWKMIV